MKHDVYRNKSYIYGLSALSLITGSPSNAIVILLSKATPAPEGELVELVNEPGEIVVDNDVPELSEGELFAEGELFGKGDVIRAAVVEPATAAEAGEAEAGEAEAGRAGKEGEAAEPAAETGEETEAKSKKKKPKATAVKSGAKGSSKKSTGLFDSS